MVYQGGTNENGWIEKYHSFNIIKLVEGSTVPVERTEFTINECARIAKLVNMSTAEVHANLLRGCVIYHDADWYQVE